MDILQELKAVFEELLALDDEQITAMMPAIEEEFTNTFTGPVMDAQIEDYFAQCDLMGYSLEQYQKDLDDSRMVLQEAIAELCNEYADSKVKIEVLDMVANLVESLFAVIALRATNRDTATIGIELIHENAKIPTYAHEGDQGADVYAIEDITIEPYTFGNMVPTGIKMMIPPGWAIAIRPRSGVSRNTPLRISNSPATIDQQYRGEVKILFDNFSNNPVTIKTGERIAQFVLEKNYQGQYRQVETVEPNTERGEGGFGSSGN